LGDENVAEIVVLGSKEGPAQMRDADDTYQGGA
jgi:hypothetical protein